MDAALAAGRAAQSGQGSSSLAASLLESESPSPAMDLADLRALELEEQDLEAQDSVHREHEIQQIATDTVAVQSIFQDLARYTAEQREQVDNVGEQVTVSHQRAERGVGALLSSQRTQRGTVGCMSKLLIFMTVLAVIVSIFVILKARD